MRLTLVTLIGTLMVSACGNARSERTPSFDRTQFLTTALNLTLGGADVSALAARRAHETETRALAARTHAEMSALFNQLAAVARREKVPVPGQVEQKKAALRENLAILPGQVFDRGYLLAVVQDSGALLTLMQRAAAEGGDLAQLARGAVPTLAARQKTAQQLLDKLGGSPFGFVPK
jgi:hypothetical protein